MVIRELAGEAPPVQPRFWTPPPFVLNQFSEGFCVGFGWSAELAASPVRIRRVDNDFARGLYFGAQRHDRAMGNIWDEGASVLAGAQECAERGLIPEYRWSFGPEDLRDALMHVGPAVIGVPYFGSMFTPRPSGLVEVDEETDPPGHCMCIIGYHPRMRLPGESWRKRFAVYKLRQSWGGAFGRKGDIYVREEDMANKLLVKRYWGEACIPVTRRYGPQS